MTRRESTKSCRAVRCVGPDPARSAGGNAYNNTASAPKVSLAAGTVGSAGGGQLHNNLQPYLVPNFITALQGLYPSRS